MKPRFNRPAYPTTRLSATARQAYIAQLARISVQYWAPIQLELSSTYWRIRGTAAASTKNGISTRGRVRAWFQPAGPDSQMRLRAWVVWIGWVGAGCALMRDPSVAARIGLAAGSAAPGSGPERRTC